MKVDVPKKVINEFKISSAIAIISTIFLIVSVICEADHEVIDCTTITAVFGWIFAFGYLFAIGLALKVAKRLK